MTATNEQVLAKIEELYSALYRHDGFGEIRIEMRILKRNQKEVIVHCGKQYRYVVDFMPGGEGGRSSAMPGAGRPKSVPAAPSAQQNPEGGSLGPAGTNA